MIADLLLVSLGVMLPNTFFSFWHFPSGPREQPLAFRPTDIRSFISQALCHAPTWVSTTAIGATRVQGKAVLSSSLRVREKDKPGRALVCNRDLSLLYGITLHYTCRRYYGESLSTLLYKLLLLHTLRRVFFGLPLIHV